ncbi:choline kinase [Novymonas esmeraldas]|uniref:ethanolamine kinase n=1 Tax=Novymonas esmeraldas TaxID=1808958 RepID=A0AAW0EPH5_9TRYP
MAQIIDAWITDDPLMRRIQIMEVVLTHCAAVMWPHHPERVRTAPEWVAKLRASIKSKTKGLGDSAGRSLESSASRRSTTPQKKALNGLVVASADVLVCQESSKANQPPPPPTPPTPPLPQSFQVPPPQETPPTGAQLPTTILTTQSSSVSVDAARGAVLSTSPSAFLRSSTGSSTVQAQYPEVGGDNNRVRDSRAGPSPIINSITSVSSRRSTEEYFEERGVPATAATTRHGEVVVVTETGSPLSERSNTPEFPSVPLQVKRLSGGITNELFHVYDEDDPSASVVVRVFGKETDRVISRESELFYQSLFIRTYVHGNNFLVYDFLYGYYTLPYQEMSAQAMPIARALAGFQVQATRAALRDYARPLLRDSQNTDYWRSIDSEVLTADGSTTSSRGAVRETSRFDRESNYLTGSLTKWVDLVLSQEIVDKVQEDKRERFLVTARSLQSACAWMVSMLERHQADLPEGVCHNDLLSANIMIHTERKEVRIIDFDYTKRSFLLYDIANHFDEYPGYDFDYDTYFPSDAHMSAFIAEYRCAMREALEASWAADAAAANAATSASTAVGASREQQIFPNARELFWTESDEAEAQVVAHWTRLAKLLTLASHLSWSVWGLVQEAVSVLDVDFLVYAQSRYDRYVAVREECSEGL